MGFYCIRKRHFTGTVRTFPTAKQFECKNTLESRRFETKKGCFYQLFVSIAELFLFMWRIFN